MRIPASIRNNNPGAMQPGPSSRKYGSASFETLKWRSADGVARTNTIATFADPIDGAAAQFDLLASRGYVGLTIQQAIAKWCGGFAVTTYIRVIEAGGLVTRNTKLTRDLLLNPDIAIPLAKSMAWQEAGREFPLTDAQWRMAHSKAFGVVAPAPLPPPPTPSPATPAPAADVVVAASTLAASAPASTSPVAGPATMPEEIVVVQAAPAGDLKKSGTIWGTVTAAGGVVVTTAEESVRFGLEWATKVVELSPMQMLFSSMSVNVKAAGLAMAAGGLTLVLTRRVKAKLEGRAG
jgi:hypothetical protein